MAKRKKNGQFTKGHSAAKPRRRSSGGAIVRSSPTVIRVAAPATKRRKVSRRRSSGGGLGSVGSFLGGTKSGHRTAIVIGSAALGYAQKQGWLAKLPVIGKAGPITSFALLGWGAEQFLHMKLPAIVSDMVTSALALSAFNVGFSGGTTLVGAEAYQMPGGAVFYD
jgi:hypothetical protein